MLRRQGRRSFTVEVKAGTPGGRTSIPAKPPRVPAKVAKAASPAATAFAEEVFRSPDEAKAESVRRVLPSLIVWEPPAPDVEPEPAREPPLPRVRRVLPAQGPEEPPRRRGRPRKVVPAAATPADMPQDPPAEAALPPAPISPAAAPVPRNARIGVVGLSRAERWKRRLPRACW